MREGPELNLLIHSPKLESFVTLCEEAKGYDWFGYCTDLQHSVSNDIDQALLPEYVEDGVRLALNAAITTRTRTSTTRTMAIGASISTARMKTMPCGG